MIIRYFLTIYSVKSLDRVLFKTFRILIIICALISGFSIFSYGDPITAIPILSMFIMQIIFLESERFRSNVFTLPLMIFLVMYIYIPLAFISFMGDNYFYGWGLNHELPFTQEVIKSNYTQNLFFLFVCILSVMATLSINKTKYYPLNLDKNLNNFPIRSTVVLGLVVFAVTFNDIAISFEAKKNNTAGSEGLIKFIFFDHAYLFLAGISIFQLNKYTSFKEIQNKRRSIISIAVLFILLSIFAGSKAGFLGVFSFFFLISYFYIRNNPDAVLYFPSMKVLLVLFATSPIVYLAVTFYRIGLTTSYQFNFMTLFEIFSIIDMNTIAALLENIFYRLSAGGFDRCMIIFNSFSSFLMPEYGLKDYLPYLLKNAVNLFLPGTPFQEAYAPSSQLYYQVIAQKPLDGDLSEAYLLRSINSQAYTIFGVMTIFGGWIAPLLLIFYNYLFCIFYNLFRSLLIRMILIYLYMVTLSSFGFEVGFGYTFHVFISLFIMYYIIKFLSKLKIK